MVYQGIRIGDFMTALDLARFKFAFTISFHIVLPALSIGLASYLAVLEAQWLRNGQDTVLPHHQ